MTYQELIRAELASNNKKASRDLSAYTSASSNAWDEAPDAFFVSDDNDDDMDCGFFSSGDEDDDMACMFFNN